MAAARLILDKRMQLGAYGSECDQKYHATYRRYSSNGKWAYLCNLVTCVSYKWLTSRAMSHIGTIAAMRYVFLPITQERLGRSAPNFNTCPTGCRVVIPSIFMHVRQVLRTLRTTRIFSFFYTGRSRRFSLHQVGISENCARALFSSSIQRRQNWRAVASKLMCCRVKTQGS